MKRGLLFLFLLLIATPAQAVEVKHYVKTSIGVFDACEETLSYNFRQDNSYDVQTTLTTTGTFGTLYPLKAQYHAYGIIARDKFLPQKYARQTTTRFNERSKDVIYENGIPLYRVSIKNGYKRKDDIVPDEKYTCSNDLLTTMAEMARYINKNGNCDFEQYSFNGKKYSLSKVKTVGYENLKTPYFSGRALKCKYALEVLDDAEAGFMMNKDEPIYFWLLQDEQTHAYFLARALIEDTPFGQLEALTTKIEVEK